MVKVKIGVFGSAFDPPTRGHQDVLQQVAPFFDRILLAPSASHAFSKKMQPFDCRVEMLECFLGELSFESCSLETSTIEEVLFAKNTTHPVYTFDLMEALAAHYGDDASLSFIRGPDNAKPEVWQRFYKAQEIEKRWALYTAEERIQARSSKVREAIAGGELDKQNSNILEQLLLPSVYDYIQSQGLYRTNRL